VIQIIIVCHGKLADGLVNAMELIAGPQEAVIPFALEEVDSIDGLEQQVEAAVRAGQPEGSLILVDMFGASPFNVSARIASRNPEVDVVTGVNLGMLLETAFQREGNTLAGLAGIAREAGCSSVKVLSEIMKD
jgi:PTS system mannose-specific IIA component